MPTTRAPRPASASAVESPITPRPTTATVSVLGAAIVAMLSRLRAASLTQDRSRRILMAVATAPVSTDVDRLIAKLGSREPGHLIDGTWAPSQSGATFAVYNPATGGVFANVALGDRADI